MQQSATLFTTVDTIWRKKHDQIRTSYQSYPPQPCSAHILSGENKLSKITAVVISD